MSLLVRPLTAEDLDPLLPLDRSYASESGCEELVSSASLSFYERSGHSFTAQEDGKPTGFLLAQAIWDGRRPAVMVRRAVAADERAVEALIEAVTKSAYDAGVYDIVVEQPQGDPAGARALEACGYAPRPARLYSRVLGSRSRSS
ncbi:MAG TPA: DUF1999 family protein [Trueperaceae bacterium]